MTTTFKPSKNDVLGILDMIRESVCLPRWSSNLKEGFYNEIEKQALNCQIAVILFEIISKESNQPLDVTLLPRIALFRAFEKLEKCDIKEETYAELFDEDSKLEKNFINYVKSTISKSTSKELLRHISGLENTPEMRAYKASTAIATYVEMLEIKQLIPSFRYKKIMAHQLTRLEKYREFPIIRDVLSQKQNDLLNLFKEFSGLRNRIRWVKHTPLLNYSVLAHSYAVAVLNYLFCLSDDPTDLMRAEKGFCVGLFHDLAENWTGDIPSPIKNAVNGLRKKTEELEVKKLEAHVFPIIPEYMLPNFKSMMLEMLPDKELRNLYKVGDDFCATFEAATQLMVGSNDRYFKKVVIGDILTKHSLKIYRPVLNKLRSDSNISYLSVALYKLKLIKIF